MVVVDLHSYLQTCQILLLCRNNRREYVNLYKKKLVFLRQEQVCSSTCMNIVFLYIQRDVSPFLLPLDAVQDFHLLCVE
ncbi:hypothetical protein EUGRSUZ_K01325 [Eucalyptus grandis]|uniref:Uncharacterized protein n=2 Tax=Eucalyptus grandis TaxID=71139 RepID=A0ACC3ISZ2_EUCGR|nr:hypothetical protein EUGRSUZ_K01325 [Eucalyptus grandis]